MENHTEEFCEFQRGWNSEHKKYCCLIGDWQNSHPLCSYKQKSDMLKKGCGIAKCEGELVKSLLGDSNATPPEIAKNFSIVIDTPEFEIHHNPMIQPAELEPIVAMIIQNFKGRKELLNSILSLKQKISKNS
jgi:hypothetical protein